VAQQPFTTPKPVTTPVPVNKGTLLDFFGLKGDSTKKEKPKKPNPTWSIQVYTGDEVASIEFEQMGKKKDDWKFKLPVAPEPARHAVPKAAPQEPKPEPDNNLPIDPNPITDNNNNSAVLSFLNDIGWSKSQQPVDQGDNAPQEIQKELNSMLAQ